MQKIITPGVELPPHTSVHIVEILEATNEGHSWPRLEKISMHGGEVAIRHGVVIPETGCILSLQEEFLLGYGSIGLDDNASAIALKKGYWPLTSEWQSIYNKFDINEGAFLSRSRAIKQAFEVGIYDIIKPAELPGSEDEAHRRRLEIMLAMCTDETGVELHERGITKRRSENMRRSFKISNRAAAVTLSHICGLFTGDYEKDSERLSGSATAGVLPQHTSRQTTVHFENIQDYLPEGTAIAIKEGQEPQDMFVENFTMHGCKVDVAHSIEHSQTRKTLTSFQEAILSLKAMGTSEAKIATILGVSPKAIRIGYINISTALNITTEGIRRPTSSMKRLSAVC